MSFSFASAQRQRSRGEGQDEGRRGRGLIHPPTGRDECFFYQPGFWPGHVFVTLTLSLSPGDDFIAEARENSFALAAFFAAVDSNR